MQQHYLSSGFKPHGERPALICLSHLRWNFVFQRPQHLMTRAASEFDVFFVEEPLLAESGQFGVQRNDTATVSVVTPLAPTGAAHADLIAHQKDVLGDLLEELDGRPIILWYYTPLALEFARQIPADVAVYDNMDELSAFRGASPRLLALEKELLRKADVVFTGGFNLYEAKKHLHHNIHAFPSSIDKAHFGRARSFDASPLDQAGLAKPRIGFFGVVDERMDIELVGELSRLRPQWQFVLLGPTAKIDVADLPAAPNLHWLGSKQYAALPSYLSGWQVGIMPFAINESTRFISPTKTPEFLAAGIPTVSTPIADVVASYGSRGLVEIASTPQDFVAKIEKLLDCQNYRDWLSCVDSALALQSWDSTWSAMLRHIDDAFLSTTATQVEVALSHV